MYIFVYIIFWLLYNIDFSVASPHIQMVSSILRISESVVSYIPRGLSFNFYLLTFC